MSLVRLSISVFGYDAALELYFSSRSCLFFTPGKAGRFCLTKHQELEPSFYLSEQQINPKVNQSPVQ